MNEIDLLKRIPQEHYTIHEGKYMLVKEVRKIVEREYQEETKRTKRAYRETKRKKKLG